MVNNMIVYWMTEDLKEMSVVMFLWFIARCLGLTSVLILVKWLLMVKLSICCMHSSPWLKWFPCFRLWSVKRWWYKDAFVSFIYTMHMWCKDALIYHEKCWACNYFHTCVAVRVQLLSVSSISLNCLLMDRIWSYCGFTALWLYILTLAWLTMTSWL